MRHWAMSLLAALSLSLALVAAGCGSSSSTHHHRLAKGAAIAGGAVVAHHIYKKHHHHSSSSSSRYRAGQFCSTRKERTYRRHHLRCVSGHLQTA